MSGADPIPAIREEDATGETAARFEDLRARLGVPFVNLIWRHLATIPGALDWTWALVEPLYGSAAHAEAAASLRWMVALPGLPPVPDYAWDAAGIGAGERTAIGALVAAYNHANSLNFLAMLVAEATLRGGAAGPAAAREQPGGQRPEPAPPPGPMPSSGPMPPLPGLDALAPPVLRLVEALDGFGRLGPSAAVASLYRHLAHWPAFLAVAHTALLPLHRSHALAREQERVIGAGRSHAARLARSVRAGGPLPEESRARALAGIDAFVRLMIGRMIVLGAGLHALLGAEPHEG